MKRRAVLAAGLAAGLARPSVVRGAAALVFVPQGNLVTMDAVWTTATVTRNAAAMVFETLYGRTEGLEPRPQMVEGALVEDGGKRWELTLREGLQFHDGEKVLARDCVASLNRWMKRDPAGQTMSERMDALEVADGLRALVDRVEWQIIPDPATAANALVRGEVDWVETPLPDLLPMLRKTAGVAVGVLDRTGYYGVLRPNWEQGPTANIGVRQAMLAAVDQVEVMTATMGDDRSLYNAPVGLFVPGSAGESEAGMELVRRRRSVNEIKAMLAAAGYKGERVVLFHPTDQVFYNAMVGVIAHAFRQVGLNVDEVSTDSRRARSRGQTGFPNGLTCDSKLPFVESSFDPRPADGRRMGFLQAVPDGEGPLHLAISRRWGGGDQCGPTRLYAGGHRLAKPAAHLAAVERGLNVAFGGKK